LADYLEAVIWRSPQPYPVNCVLAKSA